LAVATASRKSGFRFVYDSHEYFTEVPELEGRGLVKNIWSRIGHFGIPRARAAYTVGPRLASELTKKYDRQFGVVRNVPPLENLATVSFVKRKPWIFYQGALNKGRGLEAMISAMHNIEGLKLVLAGEGDLSTSLRDLVARSNLGDKVEFLGRIEPEQLKEITREVLIGVNLLEKRSRSYYYSLANKFFDYMHAGTPSITMAFPEYIEIMKSYDVGIAIESLDPVSIQTAITHLRDPDHWSRCSAASTHAARMYNWQNEEKVLLGIIEIALSGNSL
jgi:glycosyltransferase involved in cell wall biosynthesis